ncbi:MAG TPA: acyl carrier protein [Bacteroidales bacterium]|jgi:acyl carrier protein|nr:acyl carrier protein [Bacteroidales bacterium]
MENKEIINKVNDFLIDEFELEEDQLIPTASLKETLEIDSLDYVDLVVIIERNFGFKVKGEDFATIKSLQDFYDYIISRAKAN